MNTLERRCGWLLRAYPASYRRDRGDEILSTLLEVARDDQGWPSLRDTRALIMGGWRVRAAQNHRLGTACNLRLGALLGVAIWLAIICGLKIHSSLGPNPALLGGPEYLRLMWPLTLVAVALVWFARRAVAIPVLLATVLASVAAWPEIRSAEFASALVALAALALGRERPPRSWLWWLAVFAAWSFVPYLLFVILAAAVLWIVVDGRPVIALAVVSVLLAASGLFHGRVFSSGSVFFLVIGAVLAIPALVRLRRQAVL